jgi:DNA replication protein DnaC
MQSIGKIMGDLTCLGSSDTDVNKFELREDEYIKDNLIYCKKCNTGRTTIIEPFKGVKKIVRCICSCQAEEERVRREKEENEEKLMRIARLQCNSLMGEKYKNVNFDKHTDIEYNPSFKKAYDRCKKYCENYKLVMEKGYGIYLYGNPGVGKTHLTSCMANYLIKEYRMVLFTNFFEISKAIRKTYNSTSNTNEQDLLRKINNAEFLFIDDLGTESLSKNDGDNFLQDKIFEIINTRYNNNKCTIFSSNNSLKELITERNFAPKTVDRISEMTKGAVIKIDGVSYRGKEDNTPLPF